jgi:hypothetical protein
VNTRTERLRSAPIRLLRTAALHARYACEKIMFLHILFPFFPNRVGMAKRTRAWTRVRGIRVQTSSNRCKSQKGDLRTGVTQIDSVKTDTFADDGNHRSGCEHGHEGREETRPVQVERKHVGPSDGEQLELCGLVLLVHKAVESFNLHSLSHLAVLVEQG